MANNSEAMRFTDVPKCIIFLLLLIIFVDLNYVSIFYRCWDTLKPKKKSDGQPPETEQNEENVKNTKYFTLGQLYSELQAIWNQIKNVETIIPTLQKKEKQTQQMKKNTRISKHTKIYGNKIANHSDIRFKPRHNTENELQDTHTYQSHSVTDSDTVSVSVTDTHTHTHTHTHNHTDTQSHSDQSIVSNCSENMVSKDKAQGNKREMTNNMTDLIIENYENMMMVKKKKKADKDLKVDPLSKSLKKEIHSQCWNCNLEKEGLQKCKGCRKARWVGSGCSTSYTRCRSIGGVKGLGGVARLGGAEGLGSVGCVIGVRG